RRGWEVLGREVERGEEVGSHTVTHPRLTEIEDHEVRSEILGGVEAVEEVLAERPQLFRAPGFYADERVLGIVEELGLDAVFADVDPRDWEPGKDSHAIFRLTLGGRSPGAIVDLHDGYPPGETIARDDCTPTVEALEHLLPCLPAEGYEAVTVSELATRRSSR